MGDVPINSVFLGLRYCPESRASVAWESKNVGLTPWPMASSSFRAYFGESSAMVVCSLAKARTHGTKQSVFGRHSATISVSRMPALASARASESAREKSSRKLSEAEEV